MTDSLADQTFSEQAKRFSAIDQGPDLRSANLKYADLRGTNPKGGEASARRAGAWEEGDAGQRHSLMY